MFKIFPLKSISILLFCLIVNKTFGQKLNINDLGYFETQGVNVLVYSNQYTGMFFDEKTAGIEIIHHDAVAHGA